MAGAGEDGLGVEVNVGFGNAQTGGSVMMGRQKYDLLITDEAAYSVGGSVLLLRGSQRWR